jgi:hypothetical protein
MSSVAAQNPQASRTCTHCGAQLKADDTKCWLCFELVGDVSNPYAPSSMRPTPPPVLAPMASPQDPVLNGVFAATLVICVLLTLLIGVGLGVSEPGLLIPYAILVGPALVITSIRGIIRGSQGQSLRLGNLLVTYVASLGVTIGLFFLLVMGAIVLLFISCLTQSGNPFR